MLDFNMYRFPVSPSNLANIREEYKNLVYVHPRAYKFTSRYTNTERIEDNINGVEYHETYDKKDIPLSNADIYVTVDLKTKDRLDIISTNVYGYSLYWWVIAMANNIIDPFDIPIGTVLRVPQLASIYMSRSVLG